MIPGDEVLTPDSSRFLESLGWNKRRPAPPLPQEVIARTRARYLEALGRLTGISSGSQEDTPCR